MKMDSMWIKDQYVKSKTINIKLIDQKIETYLCNFKTKPQKHKHKEKN